MRLIDADKVLEKNFYTLKDYNEEEADAWRDGVALVEKEIENAPTVSSDALFVWNKIEVHPPVHKRVLKNVCGKPERTVSDYVLVWSDKFQICTYGRYYEDEGWSINDVMMTKEDIVEQGFRKWMDMPKPQMEGAE